MAIFDPSAFLKTVTPAVQGYEGAAPALLFEVYRDGVSARAAHGTVGLDDDTPARADHKFEIGSQTKMMTATVLLQLASEGKLSLDDKMADVVDVTPLAGIANIEDVTIRQLLTHSSGIPDYLNDCEDIVAEIWARISGTPPQPVGAAEFLELLQAKNAPANFAPGTDTKYSNTGFVLLEMIIEKVTGESMAEVFQTRIFDPVGMTSTSLPGFDRPEGLLRSYALSEGDLVDVTYMPIDSGAEGGVISTTGDMIRFMKALAIDQTLVPEDQVDELGAYFVASGFEGELLGHGGGTAGTGSATYVHLPTGTIFSAVETSRAPSDFFKGPFTDAMTAVAFDQTWQSFQNSGGDGSFAGSAADLDISETHGTDGQRDTVLEMGDVSLTVDGGMADLATDRMQFEDGSILHITEAGGARYSVWRNAREAMDANNQIIGGTGKDRLTGGHGDDKISGGDGRDRLSGKRGDDVLDGGAGADRLKGGRGDDALHGGAGHDRLKGGRGADLLDGGKGQDILVGGRGADTLSGGTGNDYLNGGRGADVFVFAENSGHDSIVHFENGRDKIDLSALDLEFSDLTINEFGCGFSSEISFEGGSVLLQYADAPLTVDDFLF